MKTLVFVGVSLFALLVSNWFLDLLKTGSWDTYHFMYSGQRLLEGELAWTLEYADKLLINQFLFILLRRFLEQ